MVQTVSCLLAGLKTKLAPRHFVKMGDVVDVPQEWRHFRPRGKVFILNAIKASETAEGIDETLGHYVGIGGYMEQGGYSVVL